MSMNVMWVCLVVVLLFGVGFASLVRKRVRVTENMEFANEFMAKLRQFVESSGSQSDAYGWLIHRSNKMQEQLGSDGVFAKYRPPFANFQFQNFPIVLNLLPELQRSLTDQLPSGDLANQYAMALQEALVRHLGTLHDREVDLAKSIRNPLTWLREGVRAIVALPLNVLSWLGVLSEVTVGRITASKYFSALSGLAALIGFVSAVVGLVTGWRQFQNVVVSWLKGLL